MTRTKYEFMQDMLTRARNRHRREFGLPPEQPEAAPDGQAGAFDGTADNPLPLTTDINTINFAGLVKLADKLDVPHDESQWLDDDWTFREDLLRVAVAEAMEKVGK